MKLYKPPLSRLQKQLQNKRDRLVELQRKHSAADNDRSRSSFAGKITRCQKDIESLEAKINRLYPKGE